MDAHGNAMGAPCFVIYTHGGSVLAAVAENRGAPCTTPSGRVHAMEWCLLLSTRPLLMPLNKPWSINLPWLAPCGMS